MKNWKKIPDGTRVLLQGEPRANITEGFRVAGVDGDTAAEIAGDEHNRETTIYFFPDGVVRRGNQVERSRLSALPKGTKILVGYTHGGYVTSARPAYNICGERWNYPSTFYRFPDGTIKAGDSLNENAIPKKTLIFYRR